MKMRLYESVFEGVDRYCEQAYLKKNKSVPTIRVSSQRSRSVSSSRSSSAQKFGLPERFKELIEMTNMNVV